MYIHVESPRGQRSQLSENGRKEAITDPRNVSTYRNSLRRSKFRRTIESYSGPIRPSAPRDIPICKCRSHKKFRGPSDRKKKEGKKGSGRAGNPGTGLYIRDLHRMCRYFNRFEIPPWVFRPSVAVEPLASAPHFNFVSPPRKNSYSPFNATARFSPPLSLSLSLSSLPFFVLPICFSL